MRQSAEIWCITKCILGLTNWLKSGVIGSRLAFFIALGIQIYLMHRELHLRLISNFTIAAATVGKFILRDIGLVAKYGQKKGHQIDGLQEIQKNSIMVVFWRLPHLILFCLLLDRKILCRFHWSDQLDLIRAQNAQYLIRLRW